MYMGCLIEITSAKYTWNFCVQNIHGLLADILSLMSTTKDQFYHSDIYIYKVILLIIHHSYKVILLINYHLCEVIYF